MTNVPSGQAPQIGFIDNPHAPEVFADVASGILLHNGNLHITFTSLRGVYSNDPSAPPAANYVVAARLVMPASAADAMQKLIADYLNKARTLSAGGSAGAQTIQ